MINRLPWHKKLRTSSANNLDKINEIIDYINHSDISEVALSETVSGRNVQAGKAASLKDLAVYGESIQNGTPTPENPVPVQVVEGRNLLNSSLMIDNDVYSAGENGYLIANKSDNRSWSSVPEVVTLTAGTYTLWRSSSANTLAVRTSLDNYAGDFFIMTAGNSKTFTLSNDATLKIKAAYGSVSAYPYALGLQIEKGSIATTYVPYGCIGLQIGETVTPIDLQNNVLASLPDGTKDELKIDSAGHVWIEKRVGVVDLGTLSWGYNSGETVKWFYVSFVNAVAPQNTLNVPNLKCAIYTTYARKTLGDDVAIDNGITIDPSNNIIVRNLAYTDAATFKSAMNGVMLYYELATPTTLDLGYIEPPAIDTDDEIEIIATITPLIDVGYWSYPEFSKMIADLKAYVDYKTADESNTLGIHSLNPINIREDLPIIEPVEVSDVLESEG